jgi:hypothetical protein
MSNKSTILTLVPTDLNTVADKYFQAKAEIKRLENSLKALRIILEEEILKAPTSSNSLEAKLTLELEAFAVSLSDCSRESFDLKSAKVQLGDVLKPFIKNTSYTRLNVKKN